MNNFIFKHKDYIDVLALALCLLVFSFWIFLLNYKFYHFGYYDWDLAFFSQGMWNLCHGSGYASVFGINIFTNHANLIAYIILPLYKIFPHPLTLVYLKVISYIIAAFVLYLLAKEKLGSSSAMLLLWLYLSYTPNIFGLLYEFDFESLAPGPLMLILYFYVKDRWVGFMICALFLILIKENLPLIILAFSIHALFVKKDKIRWVLIPGTIAIISFYLLVFVYMPLVSGRGIGDEHPYYIGNNYRNFGGTIEALLFFPIFHPIKFWFYLMNPLNLSFLDAIFNPLMYLPLAAPGVLFLISPILLQHLLSASPTEHNIRYAYVMTMAPFLFLAIIETFMLFYKKLKREYHLTLILLLTISIIVLDVNFHVFKARFLMSETLNQTNEVIRDRWKLVHTIPQDASVVASFSFLAQLSQRKNLYAFYKIYDSNYQNTKWPFKLPSKVEYALIDTHDPWLFTENKYKLTQARIISFLTSGHWYILKQYGRYILYKREVV